MDRPVTRNDMIETWRQFDGAHDFRKAPVCRLFIQQAFDCIEVTDKPTEIQAIELPPIMAVHFERIGSHNDGCVIVAAIGVMENSGLRVELERQRLPAPPRGAG